MHLGSTAERVNASRDRGRCLPWGEASAIVRLIASMAQHHAEDRRADQGADMPVRVVARRSADAFDLLGD